jgi:hypothetical protein
MRRLFPAIALSALVFLLATTSINAASTTIVINEVYGGAGCGTVGCSAYNRDFVELKNVSLVNQNIGGWSVQYASDTGTSWAVTVIPANTILRPGDTYLIGLFTSANGITTLPTPNTSGSTNLSSVSGKVALVNNSTPLTGACPSGLTVIDFVGYGGIANCNGAGFDTADAPPAGTMNSIQRNAAGTDTDLDSSDFVAAAPTPQPALQPTPAGVTISGRVYTSAGQGVAKAVVTIQGGSLTEPQHVRTNGFGYYTFSDLIAGETYVVTVNSKQYVFTTPSRVIQAGDNIEGVDFIAEP